MNQSLDLDLNADELLAIGCLMQRRQEYAKAERLFRKGLELDPNNPSLLSNLGATLGRNGDSPQARAMLWKAILADPQHVYAWSNLALQEHRRDRFIEARAMLQLAIKYRPEIADFWMNLSVNSQYLGMWQDSIDQYWEADKYRPNDPEIRSSIGMLYMLLEDWDRGLPLYEARHAKNNPWPVPANHIPTWDGERLDLDGKKVLLVCEQGIGDSIQFVRYAQALREAFPKVGHVSLFCPDTIKGMMELWPGVDEFWSVSDVLMKPHDVQIATMSMPRFMRLHGHPMIVPVVKPKRLDKGPRPKFDKMQIGICWRGNAKHTNDRYRSIPFRFVNSFVEHFKESANIVSLQYGMTDEEKTSAVYRFDPSDWMETVREIESLDLVISCDTAAAHLAATIGVETWLLTPAYGDWRWGISGSKTDWYPKMKIYRQGSLNNWEPVFKEVAADLEAKVRG